MCLCDVYLEREIAQHRIQIYGLAISIIAIHFEWMGEANQTEMGRLTESDAKLQIAQHITMVVPIRPVY